MSALSIQPPYPAFAGTDGLPLENGYIWIGTVNLNPQVNPIAVYWDAALTIPAAQPIRTLNGYPMYQGTPARFYAASDYSILVQNSKGSLVYSAPAATERYNEGVISSINASNVLAVAGYTGGVQRTQQSVNDDRVCVFDFMTPAQIAAVKAGTSVEDLSTAFEQAINTSKRVYIPKGRYRVNVQIDSKTILEGDGSQSTILHPYDNNVAIMTYTFTAQQTPSYAFWDYHSEVHGIGFWGRTSRVGVGFTFGQTLPSNYQTNDELANNVKFFGCRFFDLEKGIQFPFGNIGTEIYSCGFSSNKYGVYALNNKFGNGMHAGNKYFFGGEFSGNDCGLYVNDTVQGGGAAGIEFFGTIMEFNQIAAYVYSNTRPFIQCMFDGVWFESNGATRTSGSTTVTIDSWSGTTVTPQTIDRHTLILDGDGGRMLCRNVFFTDVEIKATNAQVTALNCHAERESGNIGAPCIVANTSSIIIEDSYTGFGNPQGNNIIVTGFVDLQETAISSSTAAGGRWFPTTQRGAKLADYGPSKAITLPLTTAYTLGGGAFTLLGTVVSDGRIYDECNEFSRAAFLSSEFVRYDSNVITTTAGWYVFTMDVKVSAGNPAFFVWNRGNAQLAADMTCPAQNKWFTFAGYGYSAGGDTLYFDIRGSNATCTWRNSALQLLRFDTKQEAQAFLNSGAFAES